MKWKMGVLHIQRAIVTRAEYGLGTVVQFS